MMPSDTLRTRSSQNAEAAEEKLHFIRRGFNRPKLCPNCLSHVHPADSLSGWILPEEYTCDTCNYRGHVFLEASDEK